MATSDTTHADIVLGARGGKKQAILTIPAEALLNKPGVLNLQSVTDASATEDRYLWVDSNGGLRIWTSVPTDQDGSGALVVASSAATPALDNLAAVAINASLVADSNNDTDLGSNTYSWRSAYLGTSLVFKEATANATVVAADHAVARTYTFPDAGAAADIMLDTGAANVVAYTKGTSTIAMAANSDIDMATGVTLNLDTNLQTKTEAIVLDQSLQTTDDVTFANLNATTVTATGAISDGTATLNGTGAWSGITTLAMGGALSGVTTAALSGALTCQGIVNTVAVIDSTVAIQIGADNVNLTFGAEDATDSKIYFSGSHLTFQDSTGGPYTLQTLATGTTLNPTAVGDFTIADGKFTWTNATDEANGAWTLAATTVDGIDIVSSNTTGNVLHITANATSSGNLLNLTSVDATMTSGAYIYCYDGGAQDFAVRRYGATTIAGSAIATAALTITAGDAVLSNGRLLVTQTGDNTSKIVRNVTTLTSAVLEVENTHISGGVCLLLDQDATGDLNALEITNAGTGFAATTTAAATAGGGYEYIAATSGTGAGLLLDGTTGSWIGADNTGLGWITSDGVLAAGANLLRVTSSGLNAAGSFLVEIEQTGKVVAATDGICLKISETAAATATSYAVCIASTNNEALHVDTGVSLFDETVSVITGDSSGGAIIVTNPDTTGNSNALTVNPSGSGAGVYVVPVETDTVGLKILAKAAGTVPLVNLDLATNNWAGAANIGAINSSADAAFADVAASQIYLGASNAIDDSRGHCIRIVDSSNVAGTMGYPVSITSNDATMGGVIITTHASGTALSVVGGKAVLAGGVSTVVAITDVADPPTNANMITAFGAAATAGAGFIGFINDANAGVNNWLCVSNGTNWYYATKLVVGA